MLQKNQFSTAVVGKTRTSSTNICAVLLADDEKLMQQVLYTTQIQGNPNYSLLTNKLEGLLEVLLKILMAGI